MSIRYPRIHHVSIDSTGDRTSHYAVSCISGRRVSIEQNQQIKFLMIFAVLDLHIDTNYPDLAGQSFSRRYKELPNNNDVDLIFRELYRIAKIIRNSLVHNPSSFTILNNTLDINYRFKDTCFRVKITLETLAVFHTAIVMFAKGDLGKGDYFIGLLRSIYKEIVFGISEFSDEFEYALGTPSNGLELIPHARGIILNPEYKIDGDYVRIIDISIAPELQGIDFYIVYNERDILVPREALDPELKILKFELLERWRYEGPFPSIRRSL